MNIRLKKYLLQLLHYTLEHRNEEQLFDTEREAAVMRILGKNFEDFKNLSSKELGIDIFNNKKNFNTIKKEIAQKLEQIFRNQAKVGLAELEHVTGAKGEADTGMMEFLKKNNSKIDRAIN